VTNGRRKFYNSGMEVNLSSETQARLNALATETGRPTDELVEDAISGYFAELAEVRGMLDRRYDEVKNGSVKPIDGEEALARLRRKSEERRASRS
jgi:predicted DNA-binding protein